MTEQFTEADRQHAIMQGEQNASTDAYIEARPQLDSIHNRRVFEAGFERGWNAQLAAANEQIKELLEQNTINGTNAMQLANQLTDERELVCKLEKALKAARDWLEGWASAEPYLSALNASLAEAAALRTTNREQADTPTTTTITKEQA